jgi:DNA-directed RNA polymerase specialized sigma24 family protein
MGLWRRRAAAVRGRGPVTSINRRKRLLTTALRKSNGDLLRFLHRRVGSDDAPDLFGETLLIAWRRVEDLPEDQTEARMWLFGLARGTLQNYARGHRRRLALVDKVRSHMPSQAAAPPADEGGEVRDAMERLKPELAEIVQLVHWDGFTLAHQHRRHPCSDSAIAIRTRQGRPAGRPWCHRMSQANSLITVGIGYVPVPTGVMSGIFGGGHVAR